MAAGALFGVICNCVEQREANKASHVCFWARSLVAVDFFQQKLAKIGMDLKRKAEYGALVPAAKRNRQDVAVFGGETVGSHEESSVGRGSKTQKRISGSQLKNLHLFKINRDLDSIFVGVTVILQNFQVLKASEVKFQNGSFVSDNTRNFISGTQNWDFFSWTAAESNLMESCTLQSCCCYHCGERTRRPQCHCTKL